ncbi:helix-turn-helix domain-containing protein [Pedobacter psychroterrae]|uniref:Helix-turn-helix domain-containing protein n=1 Tax=Pedobacter psychroterrae TaxID=2530453 RepID=A0A4R0NFP6_9SPHI|nr:helix-turn-helix domain-containing protein [Pedobacter psychroterrae]TCC98042.1 helix-turn-helix domain-containing protein [Pedobacter psychroterrae]
MIFVLNSGTPTPQRRFIKKPLFNFHNSNLKYMDVLVYVAIKSYDNKEGLCFPSHETIGKRAGLSSDFVIDSIKRLESEGCLSVYRHEKFREPNRSYSNKYYFPEVEVFNPIPYEIFEATDLTGNEKAMLLLLRQFAKSSIDIFASMDEFVKVLGLSKQIIYKRYNSLIKKGYLTKTKTKGWIKMQKIDWSYPDQIKINHKETTMSSKEYNFIVT